MNIALIAMSGLRAADPTLTELGMTLPGAIGRIQAIQSLPSLSLLTLAALTPERHDVTYHEVRDIADLDGLPPCDLAAISTYTAQAKDAYQLADRYRRAGVTTVIGGLHATVLPQEALGHFDAVVVGEGEVSWARLLRDFEAGSLQETYRPEHEFDLADAPVPRFDLLEPERYDRLTVQTQRGCPWRCDFCAASILLTPRYKVKPVERVVTEIQAIKRIWPEAFIEFADDNTFVNKKHAKRLMEGIAGEGVEWFTESDVAVAEDPELLRLMKEAGCAEILIGFESPRREGLEGIELKRNWKARQVDVYRSAIEQIQAHGIAVNACFVLGLDGDGPEVFDAIERFVEETTPFDVQITVMTAFPGTPLYSRLRDEDRLLDDGAWEKCTLFDVNIRPRRMSVQELRDGLINLAFRLYSQESTQHRRDAFRSHAGSLTTGQPS